jgi:hypothetical protein
MQFFHIMWYNVFIFNYRAIISQILLDRVHPFGCLLCQMQYAVLDKVNPIITKHQTLLFQRHSNKQCSNEIYSDTRHQRLSGIEHGLCNLTVDSSADHEAMLKHDVNEATVTQEEWQAFHRHFQNIAVGRFHRVALFCLCVSS